MSARLVSTRYERYERMSSAVGTNVEQFFRAIVGTLEVVERDAIVDGAFEPFTGAAVSVDQQPVNQPTLSGVSLVSALPPPTIATISPNSGTKAGGTAIAIAGTNFRPGMGLFVGGINVPVTIVDATHATAVTPPHDASPDFMADVLLVGADGLQARKPAGFTFTTP